MIPRSEKGSCKLDNMGKKLSQASMKISKDDHKKQLSSLIKILRPKVYITDPSNFKKLVQELTGNGNKIPSSPLPLTTQPFQEVVPIIEVEDHGYQETSPELSVENISDACMPRSFTFGSPPELCIPEPLNVLDSSFLSHNMAYYPSYNDLESWQLEMVDPFSYNDYDAYDIPKFQQEVCVYDYDFSSLI